MIGSVASSPLKMSVTYNATKVSSNSAAIVYLNSVSPLGMNLILYVMMTGSYSAKVTVRSIFFITPFMDASDTAKIDAKTIKDFILFLIN